MAAAPNVPRDSRNGSVARWPKSGEMPLWRAPATQIMKDMTLRKITICAAGGRGEAQGRAQRGGLPRARGRARVLRLSAQAGAVMHCKEVGSHGVQRTPRGATQW
jgi:hypothetical protein